MKWLGRFLIGAGLLAGLVLAAAFWLLATESGLQWALRRAPPELTVEGVRGALTRPISIDRLAYQGSEARDVRLRISLSALLYGTLAIDFLRAGHLFIQLPLPQAERREAESGPPAGLPLRVRASGIEIAKTVVAQDDKRYEIENLKADYAGDGNGHRVDASLSAFGAQARVHFDPAETIDVTVEKLDLARIDAALPATSLSLAIKAARQPANGFQGTVVATNAIPGPIDGKRLPVARLESRFSTDLQSLRLPDLRAALHGAGTVAGQATAAPGRAELQVQVSELDLRALRSDLRSTRLSGPLSVLVEPERQRVQGTLSQAGMTLTADAERRGDLIEVRSLRARAEGGEASGTAKIDLAGGPSVEARLRFSRFDPSRFGDYPAGAVNGRAEVSAALGEPRRGSARWTIEDSTLRGEPLESGGFARLVGERVADLDAWLRLGVNRVTARGAFGGPRDEVAWTLELPRLELLADALAGRVRGTGKLGGTLDTPRLAFSAEGRALRAGNFQLDRLTAEGSGTQARHKLALSARNRMLDAQATLEGGWEARRGWRGRLLGFRNAGEYPLELVTPTTLEIAPQRVALGRFDARVAGGRATVESLRWEEGRLASSGAFAALPAQWLLSVTGQAEKLEATLLLDGDWALVSTPQLNGRLSVRRASGDVTLRGPPALPVEMSRATLDARFTDGRVAAALELAARLGTVRVEGEAEGLTPESALAFTAEVQLADVHALTAPMTTQARLTGRVGATLKGSGTLGTPVITGSVRGDALGVDVPPYGVYLSDGRLRAELEGDTVRITELAITGGEGRFTASGTLPLRLAAGGTQLQWRAQQFRLLNRPDMRLVVSGEGAASFDGRKFGLQGALRADRGLFEVGARELPRLEDDVVVAGRSREPRNARARLPLDLDLRLDLGDDLQVRGAGFEGRIAGQLHVTTNTAGELLAQGKLETVNAKFRAYGQNLDVDPGIILFDGPIDRPALQITAWRRNQQVEAGVLVTGTVESPRVELISNPPVSEGEKLSWLVLGRPPGDASGADLALLQAAAGALLGGGDRAPINQRLARAVGLDELTVRGSSELTTRVFALGKRLSDRLYVSFEQGLGAAAENLVKLDFSLSQRWSARAQTGTTSGIGLFFRYAWD